MKIISFILFIALNINLAEASKCVGKMLNPITDICWSCIFPISIGSIKVSSTSRGDTPNPSSPICMCAKPPLPTPMPGITIGFWEPIGLIDVTRTAYCLTGMGGIQLMKDVKRKGTVSLQVEEKGLNNSFYHVHYYRYPALWILKVITNGLCLQKGDIDVAYMTEFDPTWHDDELAAILSPENFVTANPIAQAACIADCAASTVGLGMDSLHYCGGCNGNLTPYVGHVSYHRSGLQASTLLSGRILSKLHRQAMLPITATNNLKQICEVDHGPAALRIKKSQYKLQLTYPRANNKGTFACNPLGRSELIWGSGREFPYKGEDFGYLVWRKRNCCML